MLQMATSSQYKDLNEFLIQHNASKNKTKATHTRIGSEKFGVYGGSYTILPEELPVFHQLYYEHIFVKNRKEYLTEAQQESGPILIDFDFRYAYDVTERQHSKEHVIDIIQLYLEEIKNLVNIQPNISFPIFVMEKPNVNRIRDDDITKDGIHIIIGLQMDHILQTILRSKILTVIQDVIELPLKNDWDKVLDDGISQGHTNWQLYGSQKPGHEAYRVTYSMTAELSGDDWIVKMTKFDLTANTFQLLSAQYDKYTKFEISESIKQEYETMIASKNNKKKTIKKKTNCIVVGITEESDELQLSDINNKETLQKAIDAIMATLKTNEKYIKEIHEYTQILPPKYYEPGSHLNNRKVAFALKHVDERLFLTWVMLRSKASDFDFDTIPNLYEEWKKFTRKSNGVTERSIMYWAKQEAFEEYEKVKSTTIDHYIEETIFEAGDWDYAMVLYHMFKDKYVCTSIQHKKWFMFNGHRWEKDEGQQLRMAISKDLYELYSEKQTQCLQQCQQYDQQSEQHERIQRKIKKISDICIKLKKTTDKNNIMREAMEIFYDKEFSKNADSNPYLMCFTNGVYDFKTKEFRQGYPQDYITKSTGIPYIKPENFDQTIVADINNFMSKLFPEHDLLNYMWQHLASTLIGVKKEQIFTIYLGSGSNGKSMLIDLMTQCLGEYKGTVPVNLLTDKRNSIGSASPEIMALKALRLGVGQELSVGSKMNEGIVKEITGGDPLLGRALYSDSEIFTPQLSLVVCTNTLFDINSNDDGTWRRMKVVKFMAKFISEGETHTDDTKYVFPKDKGLKDKLPIWASTFISMLIEIAKQTDGELKDCPQVIEASNNYRQSQDAITAFINDKIVIMENTYGLSQTSLSCAFKDWYTMQFGNRKAPKLSELTDAIVKRYGSKNVKSNKWHNIKIREDDYVPDENVDEL
jgi:P4 family phage/plasmid primase-like protien